MNFLTFSVLFGFIACIIFTVVVMILEANYIEVSDTLIQYFFMTFGLELASTAAIKIAKYTIGKKKVEDKIKNLKENNIEIKQEDTLPPSDDDDNTTYYG